MNKCAVDKNNGNEAYVGIPLARAVALSATSSPPSPPGNCRSLLGSCLLAHVVGMVLGAANLLCWIHICGPLGGLLLSIVYVRWLIHIFYNEWVDGKGYGNNKEDRYAEEELSLSHFWFILGYSTPLFLFLARVDVQPIKYIIKCIIKFVPLNHAIALYALLGALGAFTLAVIRRVLGTKIRNHQRAVKLGEHAGSVNHDECVQIV